MEVVVSRIASLLKKVLIACVLGFLFGIFLYVSTNLISSDPCLNDWDVSCTSAVGVIETVNSAGLLAAMMCWIFLPVVALFLVLSQVLDWYIGKDRRAKPAAATKKQAKAKKLATKQTKRRKD